MTTKPHDARDILDDVRTALRAALEAAQIAATRLAGARQSRAEELLEKIKDAIHHCERLKFIVTGDIRSEENGSTR